MQQGDFGVLRNSWRDHLNTFARSILRLWRDGPADAAEAALSQDVGLEEVECGGSRRIFSRFDVNLASSSR